MRRYLTVAGLSLRGPHRTPHTARSLAVALSVPVADVRSWFAGTADAAAPETERLEENLLALHRKHDDRETFAAAALCLHARSPVALALSLTLCCVVWSSLQWRLAGGGRSTDRR